MSSPSNTNNLSVLRPISENGLLYDMVVDFPVHQPDGSVQQHTLPHEKIRQIIQALNDGASVSAEQEAWISRIPQPVPQPEETLEKARLITIITFSAFVIVCALKK